MIADLQKQAFGKLKSILFLIFILTLSFAKAQQWCPPGAVWHHKYTPIPFHIQKNGTVEDRYVGDSTINTKKCKKIMGTFIGTTYMGGVGPVDTIENFRRSFTYLEDSVLYLFNGSSFDTVVNFNAAIGDKWLRSTYNLGSFCNARRAVTVTDTNRIMVNNFSLKRIVTTYSNTFINGNTTYTNIEVDEILERMMTTDKYLFPMYCEVDNLSDLYIYNGELICYEDNTFPIYKRAGYTTCAYLTSVKELSAQEIGLKLHPNPANSHLSITIQKPGVYTIQLSDILGKLLLEEKTEGGTLNLSISDLHKGIYFLKLSDGNVLTLTEKIIKD